MAEVQVTQPELPNIIAFLAEKFQGTPFGYFLHQWENVIFSLVVAGIISLVAYLGCRRLKMVPGKLQNALEAVFGGLDEFVCGILGSRGRKYTPFIGTLFIYVLLINLFGLIPFMKSSTSSLSMTLGLALCVFVYVQYTAFKELGFLGYMDHLLGQPRGAIAFSVIIPIFMFLLHVMGELIRPISLSLRLRSNIWGDDMLLAVLAGFGLQGLPLLFFNMLIVLLGAVVQAVVFSLLSTIYFALVLPHEEEHA